MLCPCISSFKATARLRTHSLTHTALSSRVSSCLANAVQIEGAIHLLTVPKSKGQKHVGQTNSQPWVTEREEISQALPKHMQRHTHMHLHAVCVTVAIIWGLGPLATFLNVCLSSLKTGATAGVNSSLQAVHRLLLSSVIFYYLIKKQEIRFPLSEKELILLSQSNLSREREMERGGENGRESCGVERGVSKWERLTASLLSEKSLFLSFFLLDWYLPNTENNAMVREMCVYLRPALSPLLIFFLPFSVPVLLHSYCVTQG